MVESAATNVAAVAEDRLVRLRSRLEGEARLRGIELVPSGDELRMRCSIRAPGGGDAVVTVDEIFRNALAAIFPDRTIGGDYRSGDSTSCLGPVSISPQLDTNPQCYDLARTERSRPAPPLR